MSILLSFSLKKGMTEAPKRGKAGSSTMVRVNDLTSWLHAYKNLRSSLLQHNALDGTFAVLDPERKAVDRTYRADRAVDAVHLLNSVGASDELRARAEAQMAAVSASRQAASEELQRQMSAVEREILHLARKREQTVDTQARIDIASEVGHLQRKLADLADRKQTARFPHRLTKTLENMPRMFLDYDTRDERPTKYAIQLGLVMNTLPGDRTVNITVGDTT
jgi:hypothetical protein